MNKYRQIVATLSAIMIATIGVSSCTTHSSTKNPEKQDKVISKTEITKEEAIKIHEEANATLKQLYKKVKGSDNLVRNAHAVLVFPQVIQKGLIVGKQHGKGVLRSKSIEGIYHHSGFFKLTDLSVSPQASAQSKSIIFFFMTEKAFNDFARSSTNGDWKVGANTEVTILQTGINGQLNTDKTPIKVIIATKSGLMTNISVEGSKITQILISK